MKVIIPVAGIGSKLRPHTYTQPKALVPVAGKPILSHIIDQWLACGIDQFVFIIGHLGDKIEDYISQKYPNLKADYVVQEPRLGTGHAVYLARDKVKPGEPVLIILGDTIVDLDASALLNSDLSLLGIKQVDDPRLFGVADIDEQGRILRVVEKPLIPKSNLALVGVYLIHESALLFECLGKIYRKQNSRSGEFNLTDGIQMMIQEHQVPFGTFRAETWFDCGNKESLLQTNSILLKRLQTENISYRFANTIIIQPVVIGTNCHIADSILGPDVSIGDHTTIQYSIISDSIIGAYSHIEKAVLHHSIIGSDSTLKGMSQSLNIGDSTEIDFTA